MSWLARLGWSSYLVVASAFSVVGGVVAALIWSAAGGSDAAVFGLAVAIVLVAGLAYGRGEIRTFFR